MTHLTRCVAEPTPSIIDRLFNDVLAEPVFTARTEKTDARTLAVDISEDDTHLIVRASLPGFAKDSVDVEVHEGVLTINATRTEDTEDSTEKFYRKERHFGALTRRIKLPTTVLDTEIVGELKNGVLTLRLPRTVRNERRKITIN